MDIPEDLYLCDCGKRFFCLKRFLKKISEQSETHFRFLFSLLREQEAADFLGLSVRTLQGYRLKGQGARFIKLTAGAVRYRLIDLIDWTELNARKSTSDLPPTV